MNTLILLVCAVFVVAQARPRWFELKDYSFESYETQFRKVYKDSEREMRRNLFQTRLAEINTHNAGDHTYKKGVNRFTDWTDAERKEVLGYRKELRQFSKAQIAPVVEDIDLEALPSSIDWRDMGVISNVKDQGHCGSCWAFATTETVEAYWAMQTGMLTALSPQQILDCTENPYNCGGTGGCGGGIPDVAYEMIMQKQLSSEWTYPYISYWGDAGVCNDTHIVPVANITSYTKITPNAYAPLLNHIATTGPLAISVSALTWFDYESGVYSGCNQSDPIIDHSVQLVGFGTDSDSGDDYWLVKNSWSPQWGEDGYIRVLRQSNATCGVDTDPSQGTECTGGPSNMTVCGECGILFDSLYPGF